MKEKYLSPDERKKREVETDSECAERQRLIGKKVMEQDRISRKWAFADRHEG